MFKEDIEIAKEARKNARSPYNKFLVGAALRTKSGRLYTGCNIDNLGVQSICAERTAFVKALSEGEKEFESIVLVGAPAGEEPSKICMPCGYCRQFMSEFVDENFKVYVVDQDSNTIEYTIKDLLPYSFKF